MIDSVRVCDARPGCPYGYGYGELACVGFVPATVLVCQNALRLCAWLYPTTAPFLHAGYYCSFVGLRSFLSIWMSRNKNLCFCECALCCFIPFVVLGIGGSCFHFAALMFQQNCAEFHVWCQDCLNCKKGSNFWKQKRNWHPTEHPHYCPHSLSIRLLHVVTLCGENFSLSLRGIGSRNHRLT